MLDIEIEKDWAEFFCSLPHHCVPDCCGYGGMIFDAETMESFYLKIEHPRFQDWLIEAIKIIESNTRHLKKGFWFQIAAEAKFKPEVYSSIPRI
jgi:hypothetical protein